MGQTTSTPEPSSNEKRLIAEYDRLVRHGESPPPSSSSPDLERMLWQHDLSHAERKQLEGRLSSLALRLDAIERANKARALENRANELYARIMAGPNALPEKVKGDKRRTSLLDEVREWEDEIDTSREAEAGTMGSRP